MISTPTKTHPWLAAFFAFGATMCVLTIVLLLFPGTFLDSLWRLNPGAHTAPVEFRHVVGLYIATPFVVWQIINFIVFRTLPNLPIFVRGTLIAIGGLLVTFWKSAYSP